MTNDSWDALMLNYSRGIVSYEELVTAIKKEKNEG